MYLPQFHQIPENDEFWGKGFTDWVTVKRAKPLFKGHVQPRVPLNDNYYDLSVKENVAWQAKLAKDNGIFGFGIYHYWFNNEKNLLTKPAEIILENKDIDINYCYAWDNLGWKRSWSNLQNANDWAPSMDSDKKQGPAVLIPYVLGGKDDWRIHYDYLRPYFADERYIKMDNKPVFIIYHYSKEIAAMCDFWNQLAMSDGYNGIFFIFRYDKKLNIPANEYVFKYEPQYARLDTEIKMITLFKRVLRKLNVNLKYNYLFDYDKIWKRILRNAKVMRDEKIFHGCFVSYDDTPRRGRRGSIAVGASPKKFASYLRKLVDISSEQGKNFIFLTAWNEWGEGCYLEPDKNDGYGFLESLSASLKE